MQSDGRRTGVDGRADAAAPEVGSEHGGDPEQPEPPGDAAQEQQQRRAGAAPGGTAAQGGTTREENSMFSFSVVDSLLFFPTKPGHGDRTGLTVPSWRKEMCVLQDN